MNILIADDSATARSVVRRAVAALGHQCWVAEDGLQAWDTFREVEFDVVISDWLMPGLDGLQLCQRVREAAERPYTYFILLTAVNDRKHVLQAMASAVDDYLTKPLDADDLQARLINAKRIRQLHLDLTRHQAELERLNQRLREEARTDSLTMLNNRRRLGEDLQVLNARAQRYGHTYSLAMIDLDRFKQYNDSYGHQAGDEILRKVGVTIARQCRGGDQAYRYGGEEFVVITPEQTAEKAGFLLERVRGAIEALALPHPENPPHGVVTVSAGIAAVTLPASGSIEAPLGEADEALYAAKQAGRNQIKLYEGPKR